MKTFVAAAACLLAFGAAHAQTASYAIDPTHTFVSFEIGHFGTSTNRGRWDKKEGTVQFDRAGKTGRVELTIDMNSINTGVPPFDGHLKSKDLFNTAEHPTAKFVSNKFVFAGDKVTAVEGTLTLMGKSNPVTLKASNFNCYNNPMFKREVCGGDFETTIQRSQWGLGYGLPVVAPDNVRLLIQVEAIKQ
ncbi:MAG: YceI family protein [Rubrivivax sp.]|nr:YceI family protein [Rubrivivax sp.]MDP3612480.1 YceI family protein [Rubrivivax sp.]